MRDKVLCAYIFILSLGGGFSARGAEGELFRDSAKPVSSSGTAAQPERKNPGTVFIDKNAQANPAEQTQTLNPNGTAAVEINSLPICPVGVPASVTTPGIGTHNSASCRIAGPLGVVQGQPATGQAVGAVPASGGQGPLPPMMPMPQSLPTATHGGPAYACHEGGDSPCQCANAGKVEEAVKEALDFYKANAACIGGKSPDDPSTLMAINDYRGRTGCMYLVDMNGKCNFATTSDYGTGGGAPPTPGCRDESHMTPAGFHVTSVHNGERYDDSNSLELTNLQGQGSKRRAILIHQGRCGGGASTWGCSGVGNYPEVRRRLGHGALVYNYFGSKVGNCSGARSTECARDGGGSSRVLRRQEKSAINGSSK